MTIGNRILEARRAAGLSQRQLAGDTLTRNMLSMLEHDQANPSLDTLRYLSGRLKRPVSYFLEEQGSSLPGLEALKQARSAFAAGEWQRCLEQLEQVPDGEVLRPEREMLWAEALLRRAEQELAEGRPGTVRSLLEPAGERMGQCFCCAAQLLQRRAVLLARSARSAGELAAAIPALPETDEILLLRAQEALQRQAFGEAGRLLDAVSGQDSVRWQTLRGDAYAGAEQWQQALACYLAAEQTSPRRVRRAIQNCYAKLGNFEQAYRYATME